MEFDVADIDAATSLAFALASSKTLRPSSLLAEKDVIAIPSVKIELLSADSDTISVTIAPPSPPPIASVV